MLVTHSLQLLQFQVSGKSTFWQLLCSVHSNLLHVPEFASLHCACKHLVQLWRSLFSCMPGVVYFLKATLSIQVSQWSGNHVGHSSALHGLAPPPLVTQPHTSNFSYPSATANHYARYWETSTGPLAANSPYGASAAAPAAHPSVPLNSMPYPITYSYGHDAAPAPGDSFAQSMPPPPGNSFAQTLAPSSNRVSQSTLRPPGNSIAQTRQLPSISFAQDMAPHSGTSFAQSMPPPGTLPFTMGSQPREAPGSSRRAQVAAVARNPGRHRSRVPPSRSRVPPSRRRG